MMLSRSRSSAASKVSESSFLSETEASPAGTAIPSSSSMSSSSSVSSVEAWTVALKETGFSGAAGVLTESVWEQASGQVRERERGGKPARGDFSLFHSQASSLRSSSSLAPLWDV
jgi:hypothetical protein